ncbi:MAG TPA: hypothetical protein VFN23_10220 [Ktedonobacteraceae bacterium]|nr:hypothetical protein [Ktedonobacteraceae bacterium]
MSDEWGQNPNTEDPNSNPFTRFNQGKNPMNQEDLDKRIEEIRRTVSQGATEAQIRIKRVVDKASEYWQQAQTPPTPQHASSIEEQRIRQLINRWSTENWRVARDLGTYLELGSTTQDEVWEITVQTRWETRAFESKTEPYTGRQAGNPQPVLPVWDYEMPEVTGLKAPTSRFNLGGLDETLSCTACNGTGRTLCTGCNGRGWIVCPDCQGRTKKRCTTCRGRGYVADWLQTEKKPFFQKQAENLASGLGDKVADVFEGIRQQGVPIPNPVDNDPASKGRTVPCPDCVNGEVDCTCGTGKRVCPTCQGAKSSLCGHCNGTGRVVRHRELVRSFTLNTQTRMVGESAIPLQRLSKADGDLIYNAEVTDGLHSDVVPEGVPMDVWSTAVQLAKLEATPEVRPGEATQTAQSVNPDNTRATLQVMELVRIPYTQVQYHFANQDYTLYIYDSEGKEKFYADRYPTRWERIERFIRSVSTDLTTPPPSYPNQNPQSSQTTGYSANHASGYRVHVEVAPDEQADDDETLKR